jgi:hypothetical protein
VLEDNTEAMIGSQLGPYRIDALLGMGQVYHATDTRLHRTVATRSSCEEYWPFAAIHTKR